MLILIWLFINDWGPLAWHAHEEVHLPCGIDDDFPNLKPFAINV